MNLSSGVFLHVGKLVQMETFIKKKQKWVLQCIYPGHLQGNSQQLFFLFRTIKISVKMRSCMHSVKTTTTKNKQKEIHQPTNATLQSYSL